MIEGVVATLHALAVAVEHDRALMREVFGYEMRSVESSDAQGEALEMAEERR